MKENENLLMSPLWILYSKKNEQKLDSFMAEQLKDFHGLKDRRLIYKALQWTENNKDYEFVNIFERMPILIEVNFSNAFIYLYLINFKSFMENEEFGLLTDDRPTNKPWE